MAYSERDARIAAPTQASNEVDWQTLCDMADSTQDVMVAYAFGGAAPTTVKLGNGGEMALSSPTDYRRMFVTFYDYGWNPANPSYSGD